MLYYIVTFIWSVHRIYKQSENQHFQFLLSCMDYIQIAIILKMKQMDSYLNNKKGLILALLKIIKNSKWINKKTNTKPSQIVLLVSLIHFSGQDSLFQVKYLESWVDLTWDICYWVDRLGNSQGNPECTCGSKCTFLINY